MALLGSSFCCNGSVSPMALTGLPCLGIRSLCSTLCLSSYSVKQPNYGKRHKTQLLPWHCQLNMHTGRCTTFIHTSRSSGRCRAKGEDLEGSLTGESIIYYAETLERDLHTAIAEENYAKAAQIRDSLKLLKEDRKTSLLAANARFYNVFRIGDLATMQTLWAKGNEVCCVHPGARGITGYDDVITSWEYVWANYEFPLDIELKDVKVHVRGDVGYVTCVELVKTKGSSWGGQFVTNVFERIDGQWLICIHHASPIDL
ncbi:uncharacterized protein LOC21406382 isoform X2 [Morus notabilis]|uniref:uncharacterized protein LOC21406382 isoform X2 n=1 Tax=Morus notabilis TaxID=981085 RepID=UPI000CED4A2F|nr:uncharacterized protein LOC21406382 isoform X2 [Morus notabilis]